MYGLVDCNNFFVSCERTLDPNLEEKPVVVLSNNDGCVVSRSNEAKSLGIPMGAPAFQYRKLFEEHDVKVFSAKFELYNYYSQKVSEISKSYAPEYEIYSIDELFLDFHGFRFVNLESYCAEIRNRIITEHHIPVSIGIAPTKTLCKVANRIVKKFPERFANGVYTLDTPEKIEKALKWLDIGDVWGIGRQFKKKLEYYSVNTAWDFTQRTKSWVKQHMGVVGERTWLELNGTPCIETEGPPSKKTICTSRSFGEKLTTIEPISEAVANFAAGCAEKLRAQK